MQNVKLWAPSKFVYKKNKLRASKNTNEVAISSRIIVDYIADFYDKQIEKNVKGKLLDLGCGKVPLYGAYKNFIVENICVDWNNSLHKNQYLDFEVDLNKKLPFADEEFDTVILSDVLEHIMHPKNLLEEVRRILKNDGKLLMNVPFYYQIHEAPYDFFRYTQYALKMFAEGLNFEITQLEVKGGIIATLGDLLAKSLTMLPYIGKVLSSSTNFIFKQFEKTKIGYNLSTKTKQRFPLVIFMIVKK